MTREPVVLHANAPRAIEWAAETVIDGGVIALPTDTVYGLAASHTNPGALDRIYEIKGRDRSKTLPILVAAIEDIERLTERVDPRMQLLLDQYWPGPLTVALPGRPGLLPHLLAADGTVGVRMPNHPLAIELIGKAGGVLACTSANRSGSDPAVTALGVATEIGADVDLVLDGGRAPGGIPSTVVSFRGSRLVIVRHGVIAEAELSSAWAELAGETRTGF